MAPTRLLDPIGALVSYLAFKVDRLRLAKLMSRGLTLGKNVYIMRGVEFDFQYPYLIEIGDNCRISMGVRILAHDATTFGDLGVTRIARVRILEDSFIGERAIILPGVTIGPRAVVAAGSFVNRDLGEGTVSAGNPARPYRKHSDLLAKCRAMTQTHKVFALEDWESGAATQEDLIKALDEQDVAYIRGVPRKDPFYIHADLEQVRARTLRAYERHQAQELPTEEERD